MSIELSESAGGGVDAAAGSIGVDGIVAGAGVAEFAGVVELNLFAEA